MRKPRDSSWILFAVGTFFLFGITNFILGAVSELSGGDPDASLSSIFILWTGMGMMGGAVLIASDRTRSGIRSAFRLGIAPAGIIAGLTLALGMFTLKTGFISDPGSKGPIVAIASSNAVLVAAAAWLFLKEKLSGMQVAGMAAILTGIACIALGSGSAASLAGVGFGTATLILFGTTNYLLKFSGHRGGDPFAIAALLWLSGGASGVTALALCFITGRGLTGLNAPLMIILPFLAGLLLGSGMLTLKISLKRGPAGPAVAISGSNAVLVLILDLLVFGHLPPPLKIAGMVVIITGIIAISLWGKK